MPEAVSRVGGDNGAEVRGLHHRQHLGRHPVRDLVGGALRGDDPHRRIEQLVAGPMTFTAGNERHALSLPGGIRALPFICYEVIFPDLVAVDATSAQLIVNVTNDAWFGDTPGPYQHFRQAQIRAVENGLPLLRAANNGISAVVDPRGRIVDALAIDARGAIDAHVPISEQRIISSGQRWINGMLIMLLFAVAAALLNVRQRLRVN